MRRKTEKNFLSVWNTLQDYHGYDQWTAEKLARQVFENVKGDPLKRTAEYFLSKILTLEEYMNEYGKPSYD